MSSNAIPMNDDDIAQLREVVRRAGSARAGAEALGINIATLARALAGLDLAPFTISYLRATLPRTLDTLPGAPGVERAG